MVIMHAGDVPEDHHPVVYGNHRRDKANSFPTRLDEAEKAGLSQDQIVPGGPPAWAFFKNAAQNLQSQGGGLLHHPGSAPSWGTPARAPSSRSRPGRPADRIAGTLALSAYCAMKEVPLVEVHDVGENKEGGDNPGP